MENRYTYIYTYISLYIYRYIYLCYAQKSILYFLDITFKHSWKWQIQFCKCKVFCQLQIVMHPNISGTTHKRYKNESTRYCCILLYSSYILWYDTLVLYPCCIFLRWMALYKKIEIMLNYTNSIKNIYCVLA